MQLIFLSRVRKKKKKKIKISKEKRKEREKKKETKDLKWLFFRKFLMVNMNMSEVMTR